MSLVIQSPTPVRPAVPFEQMAIGIETVAELLGCAPRSVLEIHACKPSFPKRIQRRPARWVAGAVIKWRDEELGR